jgi:hypothetical protein
MKVYEGVKVDYKNSLTHTKDTPGFQDKPAKAETHGRLVGR